MKYYDQDYNFFDQFNFTNALIAVFAYIVYTIAENNFVRAISISYFLIGSLSNIILSLIIGNIWSRKSLQQVDAITEKQVENLHKVSWMPKIVGMLERFIFTTGFIISKYEFIAAWLVLKVIGSWRDNSYKDIYTSERVHNKRNSNKKNEETEPRLWRVRENVFLIGTALSLISSFFAAFLYSQIINQQSHYFYKKSLQVQPKIIHLNYY